MNNLYYLCDGLKICCKKKICSGIKCIFYIDYDTEGEKFCKVEYKNFSKKNIEMFLNTKFNKIEQWKSI